MRIWKKIALVLATLASTLIAAAGVWFGAVLPRWAPARPGHVAVTQERLARGKYLYEAVADCDGCHGQRDFRLFGGPVIEGGRGRGQILPIEDIPGGIAAPNITPDRETGIGRWSDGEKIRAIREGIGRDGRALFPLMPYSAYRSMSDYDVESLVAYLNTLAPLRNSIAPMRVPFPVSWLIRVMPQPVARASSPSRGRTAEYGAYLATIAGCSDCHTPRPAGLPDRSRRLAGGQKIATPMGVVVSVNITPDRETGIGAWNERTFVQRFQIYRQFLEHGAPPASADQFTLMPWLTYARMDADDLAAIYRYLQAQPPIRNAVQSHPVSLRAELRTHSTSRNEQ